MRESMMEHLLTEFVENGWEIRSLGGGDLCLFPPEQAEKVAIAAGENFFSEEDDRPEFWARVMDIGVGGDWYPSDNKVFDGDSLHEVCSEAAAHMFWR